MPSKLRGKLRAGEQQPLIIALRYCSTLPKIFHSAKKKSRSGLRLRSEKSRPRPKFSGVSSDCFPTQRGRTNSMAQCTISHYRKVFTEPRRKPEAAYGCGRKKAGRGRSSAECRAIVFLRSVGGQIRWRSAQSAIAQYFDCHERAHRNGWSDLSRKRSAGLVHGNRNIAQWRI